MVRDLYIELFLYYGKGWYCVYGILEIFMRIFLENKLFFFWIFIKKKYFIYFIFINLNICNIYII